MQGQHRRGGPAPRAAAEPKAPAGRRDLDINRERLIFCLTSLVGHKVTATCRNNVVYEGLFHGCCLDGDYSITLKSARLVPSKGDKSGEVIRTLVIPGKDFLTVSASDVPPLAKVPTADQRRFATDGEIAETKRHGRAQRELVSWQPEAGDASPDGAAVGPLGSSASAGAWDQFAANEQLYGVGTTFNEELYTTKLDPSTIPREKREEAERIAAEIERGRNHAEAEGVLDGDYAANEDQEELRFSAVTGAGGKWRKDGIPGAGPPPSSGQERGRSDQIEGASRARGLPLTEEHVERHEALTGSAGDSFAKEHRAKRGMITDHRHVAHAAHSPMRSPMISEMKRINALNLEPALPKLDDKTRSDWINFKQSQMRPSANSPQGLRLKSSLQESLRVLQNRDAKKAEAREAEEQTTRSPNEGGAAQDGGRQASTGSGGAPPGAQAKAAGPKAGGAEGGDRATAAPAPAPEGGETGKSKPFSFNAAAKEFSFNPAASSFTPTGACGAAAAAGDSKPAQQPQQPQPAVQSQQQPVLQPRLSEGFGPKFAPKNRNPEMLRRNLGSFLDGLLSWSVGERTEDEEHTIWPHATGQSFKEILGQPTMPPNGMHMMMQACSGGPGQAAMQPQGGCAGPMPGGFKGGIMTGPGGQQMMMMPMAGGPPGPGGQQQGPMGFQMYSGPRPQGGQNQGMQQGMQQGQQPQGGQPVMFQQGMPPQGMMVQGGMQGGNGMPNMPKFGQMMMIPAGQVGPQGFMPGQGQMMPQGQMMQPQVGFVMPAMQGNGGQNGPGRGPT